LNTDKKNINGFLNLDFKLKIIANKAPLTIVIPKNILVNNEKNENGGKLIFVKRTPDKHMKMMFKKKTYG
jgi:hypothetical protein